MALWHCVVTSDQCYLFHLSGVLIGDTDSCHYVVNHRNKNTNKMNGELKKDSSLTEEKRQRAIERWTDIVRLRVTGENWTLCWMSVITEQILGLAFQEQPIISHYPSLSVSLICGLRPFVSHRSYWPVYWRWFIWSNIGVLLYCYWFVMSGFIGHWNKYNHVF